MESKKNKKGILILIIFIILFTVIGLILLFSNRRKGTKTLNEPIKQEVLNTASNKKVVVKVEGVRSKEQVFNLWKVSNKVKLEDVRNIANGLGLKQGISEEASFYNWGSGNKKINYNVITNTLFILGDNILTLDSLNDVNASTFSDLVKKYFNYEWDYDMFYSDKLKSGETVYYARRYLFQDIRIEIDSHNQQTDYIAVKDGKILYAKLLLTEFVDSNILLPIISHGELANYINQPKYPKSIYIKRDIFNNDPVFESMEYIPSEYEAFNNSVNDCKSDNISLVYLYKNMNQGNLTPVYKIESVCSATYKNKSYSVPAVVYTNAINPNYVISNK